MKLPRDVPGMELASLLRRHGYEITRQTGSHLRLTSVAKGSEHQITIPRHRHLRVRIAIIPALKNPIRQGRGLLKGRPSLPGALLEERRLELEREERKTRRPKADQAT